MDAGNKRRFPRSLSSLSKGRRVSEIKVSHLFLEDWAPSRRYQSILLVFRQTHRIITLTLVILLLAYALLKSTFMWVGAALAVISIIVLIDFRATWQPSLRNELIVIAAMSSVFFIGALVEQNVAVYFGEAPRTYHLENFVIGFVIALLLFGRLECALFSLEFGSRSERLLEPVSFRATKLLQTANAHARTLGPLEFIDEATKDREFEWDLRTIGWTFALGILMIAIFSVVAILISILLPFHPQLGEMESTIRPETFLFILLFLAVLLTFFIDQGLKKVFKESSDGLQNEESLKEQDSF